VAEAMAILNFKEVASKFKKIDETCFESQYLSAGEYESQEI
jgi:cytochrome c oxidase assembly protein Cox11